mmetsp:Transcript_106590/g.318565  ORF Transcript_106590/g.318565 Transcript_106590/m.318565 type:complete len:237 (-) Transcript_106590:667-1377(-)
MPLGAEHVLHGRVVALPLARDRLPQRHQGLDAAGLRCRAPANEHLQRKARQQPVDAQNLRGGASPPDHQRDPAGGRHQPRHVAVRRGEGHRGAGGHGHAEPGVAHCELQAALGAGASTGPRRAPLGDVTPHAGPRGCPRRCRQQRKLGRLLIQHRGCQDMSARAAGRHLFATFFQMPAEDHPVLPPRPCLLHSSSPRKWPHRRPEGVAAVERPLQVQDRLLGSLVEGDNKEFHAKP